jgi:hypothetical protein
MANEVLVAQVKQILGLAKSGKADEAYAGWIALFSSPEFATYPIGDRRQALKILVNAKIPPNNPAKQVVEAHRSAGVALARMVDEAGEPADMELLGICHVFTGDEKSAAEVFRRGLTIERARDAGSPLCGSLMKWVAAV